MNKLFSLKQRKQTVEFEFEDNNGKSYECQYTPLSSKQRDGIKLDDTQALVDALKLNISCASVGVPWIVGQIYDTDNVYDFWIYLENLAKEAREAKSDD